MPDQPTLPEILDGTLAHHAELLGDVAPTGLDGVARRVDRRRARRRLIAVGGSVAVVAVGAAGLLLLPGDDGTVPGATNAGTAQEPFNVWRCTGDLGRSDGDADGHYFSSCAPITIPPDLNTAGAVPPIADGTAPIGEQTYTVVAGDSIFEIAQRYGIDMQTLVNYNRWSDGIDHTLAIGEVVKIPPGATPPTSA